MLKNFFSLAAAAVLGLTVAFSAIGAVSYQEIKTDEGRERLVVENQFYRIEIEPSTGGKIASWFDKLAEVEIVHWGKGNGGLLDDRDDRRKAEYKSNVVAQKDDLLVLELSYRPEDSLQVVKTLTFQDGTPVVGIKYLFLNDSQKNLFGFSVGARNFFVPGGGSTVTEEDHYSVPTTHAIRRIKGFTMRSLDGGRHPEFGTKLKTAIARPWAAFIDSVSKQGLAVSLEDNFYVGWYAWKDGAAYPTFEWMFGDLPAGYQREAELNLIQVNGLSGASYASPEMVADMRIEQDNGQGLLKTELLPLADDWYDCRITTEARQVGGAWRRRLGTREFDELPSGKIASFALDISLPGEGLYEFTQTVQQEGKKTIKWSDVVTVGNVDTEPIYKMEYRSAKESRVISGWRADEEVEVVGDDASIKRGYGVLALAGEDEGKDISKWSVHMARDEYESVPFQFHPFRTLGNVKVKLVKGESVGARARVEVVTSHDSRDGGRGITYSYLIYDHSSFEGTEPTKLWVTVGNGDLKPGKHSFQLVIEPENGESKSIEIEVNVHDIALPHRPIISLEAEGYQMSFPRVGLKLRDERDGTVMDAWLQNMTTHGIDFFQEVDGLGRGRIDSYLKVLGSDTTLLQDKRARPDAYENGNDFPDIDFSAFDFYFDRALAQGMVRFKMSHYNLKPKNDEIIWRFRQLANYLNAKGFAREDLFVKIMDEQPANRFPEMATTGKWLKEECGFRPFSTFSQLFGRPEHLAILNPYFDMYQGGFTTREDWQARLKEGLIDASDEVGVYTGTGTMRYNYERQVAFGWNAAFHGHHFFHNHEYLRGGNRRRLANIVLIGEDDLPVDSPAFEGLRDGMESANLIALYREWRSILKDDSAASEVFAKLDREMDAIMAESPEALVSFSRIESRDGFSREINPLNLTTVYEAHRRLLEVLGEVATLAKQTEGRYAMAAWDGVTFYSSGRGLVTEAASGATGETAAAAEFRGALSKALGGLEIPTEGGEKTTVVFRLIQNQPDFPYSYQINKLDANVVEIRGSSVENLLIGARNLVNAMKVKGAWR